MQFVLVIVVVVVVVAVGQQNKQVCWCKVFCAQEKCFTMYSYASYILIAKYTKTSGVKYRRKQVLIKYRYFSKSINIDTQEFLPKITITNIHICKLVTYFDFQTLNFLGFFNICPIFRLFPFQNFFCIFGHYFTDTKYRYSTITKYVNTVSIVWILFYTTNENDREMQKTKSVQRGILCPFFHFSHVAPESTFTQKVKGFSGLFFPSINKI